MKKVSAAALALALAQLVAPAPAPAVGPTLYVQDHPIASTRSTGQYADFFQTYADDFVVPSGETWDVGAIGIDMIGEIPDHWEVRVYANSSGLPGAVQCSENTTTVTTSGGFAVFEFTGSCSLAEGTYWVEVRPVYTCNFGAGCVANMRFTDTITNSEMAYMNDTTCTSWESYSTCTGQTARDLRFAIFASPVDLTAGAPTCVVSGSAEVAITAGDPPFTINYQRDGAPQSPINAATTGSYLLPGDPLGPNAFTNVSVTEASGDTETLALTDVTCSVPLSATAACDAASPDDLVLTINGGDGSFLITTSAPASGVPTTVTTTGALTLPGPDRWTDLTVTEQSGDLGSESLGELTCVALAGSITVPGTAPGTTDGPASPYPATAAVAGLDSSITDVDVSIFGLGHSRPGDVEILLVSPAGTAVLLMNDACASFGGAVFDFTFDDEAPGLLPTDDSCSSGVYQPSPSGGGTQLTPPAPAGPYATSLSAFAGEDPNGTWSLYVYDDLAGDYGDIDGWSLQIVAESAAVATDDTATTDREIAVIIDVLANDAGDAPLSVTSATDPQNGSVTVNGDGTITYTPDPGYCNAPGGEPDTFEYVLQDGLGPLDEDTGTVAVTVTCVTTATEVPTLGPAGLAALVLLLSAAGLTWTRRAE